MKRESAAGHCADEIRIFCALITIIIISIVVGNIFGSEFGTPLQSMENRFVGTDAKCPSGN